MWAALGRERMDKRSRAHRLLPARCASRQDQRRAKPYVWHKSADEIFDSLASGSHVMACPRARCIHAESGPHEDRRGRENRFAKPSRTSLPDTSLSEHRREHAGKSAKTLGPAVGCSRPLPALGTGKGPQERRCGPFAVGSEPLTPTQARVICSPSRRAPQRSSPGRRRA